MSLSNRLWNQDTERLANLQKATQLINDRDRLQTQEIYYQIKLLGVILWKEASDRCSRLLSTHRRLLDAFKQTWLGNASWGFNIPKQVTGWLNYSKMTQILQQYTSKFRHSQGTIRIKMYHQSKQKKMGMFSDLWNARHAITFYVEALET